MKALVLSVLVFFSLVSYTQIVSKQSIIDLQFSAQKDIQSYPTTLISLAHTSSIKETTKSVNFTPRYGFFIDSSTVIGVGIELGFANSVLDCETFLYEKPSILYYLVTDKTSKTLMPCIWVAKYFALTNKLYLSLDGVLAYGKISYVVNKEINYFHAYEESLYLAIMDQKYVISPYLKQGEGSSSEHVFRSRVSPCLSYFISKHVALKLNTGGAYYQCTESISNSVYGISVHPNRWTYGISITL